MEQTTTATLVLSQPNQTSSANQPIRRYSYCFLLPLMVSYSKGKNLRPGYIFLVSSCFWWLSGSLVTLFFLLLQTTSNQRYYCKPDGDGCDDHDSDLIARQRQTKSRDDYQEFLQVCFRSFFYIYFLLLLPFVFLPAPTFGLLFLFTFCPTTTTKPVWIVLAGPSNLVTRIH